jgi:hypothetical protein
MLDHFEPASLTAQMFMTVNEEMRSLHTGETKQEGQISYPTVWEQLTEALASLNEYVTRRRSKQIQTSISTSPEC